MRVMLSVLDVTKAPLPCEAHMVKATKEMLQILILDVYPTKNMKEKKNLIRPIREPEIEIELKLGGGGVFFQPSTRS